MLTDRERDYLKNLPKEIAERPVKIFPWEKHSLAVAQSVIDDIKSVEPDLEVFLRGSVPLKIAGQKDIDLTSIDSVSQFQNHRIRLEKIVGEPNKINDSSIVWHFIREGYEVGFYITDPKKSDQLQRQTHIENLLKNNPSLLAEYEQLKISLNGFPYRTFLERKCEFFNKFRG